jgi:hypothetical protein
MADRRMGGAEPRRERQLEPRDALAICSFIVGAAAIGVALSPLAVSSALPRGCQAASLEWRALNAKSAWNICCAMQPLPFGGSVLQFQQSPLGLGGPIGGARLGAGDQWRLDPASSSATVESLRRAGGAGSGPVEWRLDSP